ncbi:ABC-three component system middle component 2 [Desulfocicer niacini]
MRTGELLVRRGLIEKGLVLMISRRLIQRFPTENGFNYVAGETAAPFLASVTAIYFQQSRDRAQWVVKQYLGIFRSELILVKSNLILM